MRPAVLTIDINDVSAGGAIRLSGPAVHRWPAEDRVLGHVSPGTLLSQRLHGSLVEMKDAVRHQLAPDWATTGPALKGLIRDGGMYWDQMLGPNRAKLAAKLGDALRGYAPHPGQDVDPRRQAENAPVIEVTGPPSTLLPIDLLALGPRLGTHTPTSRAEVLAAAALLPAFFAVVNYVPRELPGPTTDARDDHGLLPQLERADYHELVYLRSRSAPAWKQGQEAAQTARPGVPFPEMPDHHLLDRPEQVARFLLEPWPVTDGRPAATEIYVHAHGLPPQPSFNRHLRIGFDYGKRLLPAGFELTGGHLQDAIDAIRAGGRSRSGPTVLLNCCHAGGGIGQEVATAALALTAAGVAVVIGPRDEIPGGYGAAFAQRFFSYLPEFEHSGQTLLASRLATLQELHSPLGCMYFAFGKLA